MQKIKNFLKYIFFIFKPDYQGAEHPIFIVGTNRSGTSILTYLLSQNPSLEGLFTGHTAPSKDKQQGHTLGYCESYHIWSWINSPKSVFYQGNIDASFWCHPKYIKELYQDHPNSNMQSKALRSSVQFHRKTNRIPLIKDQFNLLRIGLIKHLFPKSKIVLVYRDYEDFIKSCSHKWFKSNNQIQPRSIGIQWLVGNLTAYFDAKFFEANFYVVNYNELLQSEIKAKKIIKNLTEFLEIPEYNYDVKAINTNLRFSEENQNSPFDFKIFDPIINLDNQCKNKIN